MFAKQSVDGVPSPLKSGEKVADRPDEGDCVHGSVQAGPLTPTLSPQFVCVHAALLNHVISANKSRERVQLGVVRSGTPARRTATLKSTPRLSASMDQNSPITCPSLREKRLRNVVRSTFSETKRTLPSHNDNCAPPTCRLRGPETISPWLPKSGFFEFGG